VATPHRTHNPPHEKLLVGLGVGVVPFVFSCRSPWFLVW
jgi:hypothetical protein